MQYSVIKFPRIGAYFAMARGYQGPQGDVKALAMKKWFNTNYHYIVPELDDDMEPQLRSDAFLDGFWQAKGLGIKTKPVVIGPFTFLKLAHCTGKKTAADFAPAVLAAKGGVKVLLQTYFGDVRDCYEQLCALSLTALGWTLWRESRRRH